MYARAGKVRRATPFAAAPARRLCRPRPTSTAPSTQSEAIKGGKATPVQLGRLLHRAYTELAFDRDDLDTKENEENEENDAPANLAGGIDVNSGTG